MERKSKQKKQIEINNTVYVNKVTPIDLCGKTIMWQLSLDGVYTVPFEIDPTPGKHDYKKCDQCQKSIAELTKSFIERFNGNANKKGFPFCCVLHGNLPKLKEFRREEFEKVPNMVARKIVYTIQHFINVADDKDWLKKCGDYLEWAGSSFGQMPNDCGEPLFLSAYFFHVESMLIRNTNIPEFQKPHIKKIIHSLKATEGKPLADISILAKTYEKWLNVFPFELNEYFGDLKDRVTKNLLILDGEPQVNIYSGLVKSKLHSKETLIEALINLTDELLTKINGATLYEKGLITDANKTRLDIIVNARKVKIKQGYRNKSIDENSRYRKIIKEWFKDEKEFFKELTAALKHVDKPKKQNESIEIKAPIISQFCCLVNESMTDVKKENENVLQYCKRICQKYGLKFTDRVRQGFSNSRNVSNIEKVKNLILPKIDQESKEMIINYLDSKQGPKQKLYA